MARRFVTNEGLKLATAPFASAGGVATSFMCWAKVADNTATNRLITLADESDDREFILLDVLSGTFRLTMRDNSYTAAASKHPTALTNGVWAHCAGSFNASNEPISYLDGVAATRATPGVDAGGTLPFDNVTHGSLVRNSSSFSDDCTVAWATIWRGVELSAANWAALAKGAHPFLLYPSMIVYHCPLNNAAEAGEVDLISGGTLTETGTVDYRESPLVSLGSPTFVTREAAAVGGTHPVNPFGHPFHGPFAGPIGF